MKYYGRCATNIRIDKGRNLTVLVFVLSLILLVVFLYKWCKLRRYLKAKTRTIALPLRGTYIGTEHVYQTVTVQAVYLRISVMGLIVMQGNMLLQSFLAAVYSGKSSDVDLDRDIARTSYLLDTWTGSLFTFLMIFLFIGPLKHDSMLWRKILRKSFCGCCIQWYYPVSKVDFTEAIDEESVKQASEWEERMQNKLSQIPSARMHQLATMSDADMLADLKSPKSPMSPMSSVEPDDVMLNPAFGASPGVVAWDGHGSDVRERSPSNMDYEGSSLLT